MVRSDLVVLPEPGIDCDLSLFGGVEPFSVEDCLSPLELCQYILAKGVWPMRTTLGFVIVGTLRM